MRVAVGGQPPWPVVKYHPDEKKRNKDRGNKKPE